MSTTTHPAVTVQTPRGLVTATPIEARSTRRAYRLAVDGVKVGSLITESRGLYLASLDAAPAATKMSRYVGSLEDAAVNTALAGLTWTEAVALRAV